MIAVIPILVFILFHSIYYASNAGNAKDVEKKLREIKADYFIYEGDISNEDSDGIFSLSVFIW
ncbi:MAG: hypothetical protein K6G84_06270 [Lachnospiraceae bacterium]|nr:hypothetical protein [Lachnospiraceae bacterium]